MKSNRILEKIAHPFVLLFCVLVASWVHAETAGQGGAFFFEREVRPVLAEHCYSCHGPEKQKSGLRLDSAAGINEGGSKGPAIVPGDTSASLLIQAITHSGDLKMPSEGEKLPQAAIDALTAWVNSGAELPASFSAPPVSSVMERGKTHWAYQPLQKMDAPPNAVDAFIAAKLAEEGLHPAPPADKRTLLRRVTFDLTGLPPTPDEINAFLADDSAEAYARVVDRLLASPQYGERWARHWLDVVRYTDSFDSRASVLTDPAEIWRYRDWVVNSFNQDMPYDQFLRMQVAGDLLPTADGSFNRDGLVATGVLAIGHWPQGDADKQKMVSDIVDDQIDLVTRAFLSSTMACARCHDHKFDPFTAKDYYALAGIFFSSSILPGPGAKTEGSPILHLPIASQAELAERKARDEKLATLRTERETLLKEARTQWAEQEVAKTAQYLRALGGESADTLNPEALQRWSWYLGLGGYKTLDQVAKDIQGMPGLHARNGGTDLPSAVGNTGDREVKFATITQPAHSISVHPSPTSPVSVAWRSPVAANVGVDLRVADADEKCGNGVQWVLEKRSQGAVEALGQGDVPNGMARDFKLDAHTSVTPGDFVILRILPNGDHSCDTTRLTLSLEADNGAMWNLEKEVLSFFTQGNPWPDAQGNAEVWWLFDDGAQSQPNQKLFAPFFAALEKKTTDNDTKALDTAAKLIQFALEGSKGVSPLIGDGQDAHPPLHAEITGEKGPYWIVAPPIEAGGRRESLEAELVALEAHAIPPLDYAVGIQEGGVPTTEHEGIHDVQVHKRGNYNTLGDLVPRAMPAILAGDNQTPITEGSGRKELADWIASPQNPLTARVMVNRIWQHHFGEGLVRTPGDFGYQGEAPTHPELLDWLAAKFIESGWSMKAVHREILLSATYQQSSKASPESLEKDPENRFLSHVNRRRIEAEVLRDSILSVSGRLDLSPGGPAYSDFNTPRRTLYLRCNRSDRSTYTMLFDAADPTSIMPKRVEAIIAPQALFQMNHPFILDEAVALAKRISAISSDTSAQVEALYELLFGRSSTAQELDLAQKFLAQDSISADERLNAYVQALLCSNEFIFVD